MGTNRFNIHSIEDFASLENFQGYQNTLNNVFHGSRKIQEPEEVNSVGPWLLQCASKLWALTQSLCQF